MQFTKSWLSGASAVLAVAITVVVISCEVDNGPTPPDRTGPDLAAKGSLNPALIAQGQTIFRFGTYGDETFWTWR